MSDEYDLIAVMDSGSANEEWTTTTMIRWNCWWWCSTILALACDLILSHDLSIQVRETICVRLLRWTIDLEYTVFRLLLVLECEIKTDFMLLLLICELLSCA